MQMCLILVWFSSLKMSMADKNMKISIVGGGPAGLYFAALVKGRHSDWDVAVYEKNRLEDTFGFGVVFSDETLGNIEKADPETYAQIVANFAHWDDIDVHIHGELVRSGGHGFAGLSRKRLLQVLFSRCEVLGVNLCFEHTVSSTAQFSDSDLIIAADGLNSQIRKEHQDKFKPSIDMRSNRFTWLGTTRQFPSFTFYFKENEHGLWRVHAYNYEDGLSTFIIETTEAAWRASGMDKASEDDTIAYCEALFETELEGHRLVKNRSIWRQFPTVSNENWFADNVVLLGDAAHTAHFSIGSGTKLAMEDSIELATALEQAPNVNEALKAYESSRRNDVESTQRAAQVSLEWFENTERIFNSLPPLQFAFSLLTRSLRITHENLRLRDPSFVQTLDEWFAKHASCSENVRPMFTPYKLRELKIENRVVVSPMCMYSAIDGTPNDFHLVHLGSRAVGGAGLLMTEMTNVTRDGRITPGCTGMYKPEHVEAWTRVVNFVHEHSKAAIGIQLGHAGRKGSTKKLWEGADEPLDDGNWEILAPSSIPLSDVNQIPIEMSQADLDRTRDAFVTAAQMANTCGFGLVELHCAHGYLLHTFLSPITNKRTDRYGGSLENRMRFPLEVFKCMRAVWPTHKPMVVRISATDWVTDGWDIESSVIFSRALKEAGCDMIDVSSGQLSPESRPEDGRLYQTPFAERIKHEVDMPTMTVGNISSYADCNSVLLAGRADLCVIARAHLFDPYWSRHAAFEQSHDTMPWPQQYATMQRYFPRMDWSNRTER